MIITIKITQSYPCFLYFGKSGMTTSCKLAATRGKHSAIYYGKSKDGTPYVYSKNGVNAKPGVFKLSEVNKIYNAGNKIQPTYHNYNPNN